jgi:hypothetical protein
MVPDVGLHRASGTSSVECQKKYVANRTKEAHAVTIVEMRSLGFGGWLRDWSCSRLCARRGDVHCHPFSALSRARKPLCQGYLTLSRESAYEVWQRTI